MGALKKKPKPFSAMSKVLCGDVQSRRLMVFASLVLVLLGCLALYLAMQNEEWTQDEPTQRKVFLLASVLLITSIALCYYALNGELEEEREMLDADRLTGVKYGDYNSCKPSALLASYPQVHGINNGMEDKYLKILQPSESDDQIVESRKVNKKYKLKKEKSNQSQKQPDDRNSNVSSKKCYKQPTEQKKSTSHEESSNNGEKRNRSLIVELMPLLPLQLCERELANLNNQSNTSQSTSQPISYTFPTRHSSLDSAKRSSNINDNSDAG